MSLDFLLDRFEELPATRSLLEPLQLTFVVAQDHRRRLARYDLSQPLHVAIHRLRREQREPLGGVGGAWGDPREGRDSRAPRLRVEHQVRARRRLFAEAARDLEVMCRVGPGAVHLALDRGFLIHDQQGIGRE